MMSVTRAISHAPPYPMSFAETSPMENSRPVARPSEAARPKSSGMAMGKAAPAPHPASQMMMPMTGGRCWAASEPAIESPSRTSPIRASTTATCSRRASRDGCPRAVTKARTATPEAVTDCTSASGASRRAAT